MSLDIKNVLCVGPSHWLPLSALTNYTSPGAIVLIIISICSIGFSLINSTLSGVYCLTSTVFILFPTLCLYDPCSSPAFVCQVWSWMTVIIPFILMTCTIATFASVISTLITGATAVGNQANRGVNFAENQGNRGVNYVNDQRGGKKNKKNKRKNK